MLFTDLRWIAYPGGLRIGTPQDWAKEHRHRMGSSNMIVLSDPEKARPYAIEATDLFTRFASLRGEGEILAFASQFGFLRAQGRVTILDGTHGGRTTNPYCPPFIWEHIDCWEREIREMGSQVLRLAEHKAPDEAVLLGALERNGCQRDQVRSHDRHQPRWLLSPETLGAALWVQLWCAWEAGQTVRMCAFSGCHRWVLIGAGEPGTKGGKRADAGFCSPPCQFKAYRRRLKTAKEMHAHGCTADEIVARLTEGRNPREAAKMGQTIRRWIRRWTGSDQ